LPDPGNPNINIFIKILYVRMNQQFF
jgi:hypothetical protein